MTRTLRARLILSHLLPILIVVPLIGLAAFALFQVQRSITNVESGVQQQAVLLQEQAQLVPKSLTRSPGHYEEWLLACKGGPKPVSNFDYAGPMTEIVLLGVLALRTPGQRLEWDGPSQKVKNVPELNEHVHIPYRQEWKL